MAVDVGSEREFVFDSLVATFGEIVPALPGGAVRLGDGFRVHVCPAVPSELFCGVWLTDPARDTRLAELLPDLVEEVESVGLPCPIFVAADGYESSKRAARSMGFVAEGVQETMVLGAGELRSEATVAGWSVSEAHDAGELSVALGVAAAGFGAPADVLAPLYDPSLVSVPGATVYVGSVAGTPVSTGVGYLVRGAIGVYSVATPPDHRRLGYAGRIVHRIVSDGFRGGAKRAYLLSTPEGAGVYRRAGFRSVGEYEIHARATG